MKILLTGGAGFIGSWVAERYIKEGHDVLILDDLSTGRMENIPESAAFIKCDIRDDDAVRRAFAEFRPDVVNHHAAQIDVRKSVEDPAYDASVNIIGTIRLLESSVKSGVKRFIFASTGGAIYGEPANIPADEKTPPMPISAYGTSKYAVEKYLEYYRHIYSLDSVALRYANVYGPRQNPHGEAGVVAIFCSRILSGKPCTIFGDGEQTRDYVYAGDVARANLCALRQLQHRDADRDIGERTRSRARGGLRDKIPRRVRGCAGGRGRQDKPRRKARRQGPRLGAERLSRQGHQRDVGMVQSRSRGSGQGLIAGPE